MRAARTLKILAVVAAAFIAVVIALLLTIDVNQYKDNVIQVVEKNTGREFRIEGDIGLAISLVPTVVIEQASLGNADWGTRPDMVAIDRLEVAVAVLPLLSGEIQVNRFNLVRPRIFLETDAKGNGNWIMEAAQKQQQAKAPAKQESSGALPEFNFRHVLIEQAELTFHDGRTGEDQSLAVERVELHADGSGSPMQVDLEAQYGDYPLRLAGSTGSLEALLANESFPVNLQAGVAGLEASLNGAIARPLAGDGIKLEVGVTAASLADLPGTDLPDAGPLSIQASLSGKDRVYELKPLEAHLGDSDLSGQLKADTSSKRPLLSAELHARQIDLTPFEPEESEEPPPTERLFSDEPLPVAALRSADATLSLDAATIRSRRLPMEKAALQLKLRNGTLSITPLNAAVAGGRLSARAALAARGKDGMELDLALSIRGLQPGRLPQFEKKDYIHDAPTDVDLKATGQGNSVRAIMAGLDGSLLVKVGEGTIRSAAVEMAGADLITKTFSMLTPSSDENDVTQLQCGVVNFKVEDGIAVSDGGIAMETPRMTVVGGGTVNFRNEKIDLGMRPHAREGIGIGAGQLTELVRLRGTLAKPEAKPDTIAAVKTAATIGAAVATGGLSLLAGGLLERATSDPHPCATALGEKAATETTEEPASEPAGETEEKESVGDKVKGMFKGLFGD